MGLPVGLQPGDLLFIGNSRGDEKAWTWASEVSWC